MSKYNSSSIASSLYLVKLHESTGATPMHEAAKAGDIYTLDILARHRENLEIKDKNGRTPLHYAATFNQKEAYMLLVSKGSNQDAKDNFDETPREIFTSHDATQLTGESFFGECNVM